MAEIISNKPPGSVPPVTGPVDRPQVFPENPLVGSSNVGAGVTGKSAGEAGVLGTSVPPQPTEFGLVTHLAGDGVQGTGENGVHGMSASATNSGVLGENSSRGAGVMGTSVAGFGLHGRNTSPVLPTVGVAPPGATPPPSAASSVKATDCGVFGESLGSEGVFGVSALQHGVHGVTATVSGSKPAHPCGVWGESSAGYGVCATSDSTNGLWAASTSDHGVLGQTSSQSHAGVYGWTGVGSGKAPKQGAGIWGDSDQGIGVYGASKSGNAGQFDGNILVTGDVTANHMKLSGDLATTGKVTANDVFLSGMDCAEEFDISGNLQLEPGTVVVFDGKGAVSQSAEPYNKRVAGVISGAGKYRPGLILGRDGSSHEGKAAVALMGRVYCKVDASYSPIEVGDLLTTSLTSGCAMKASDPLKAFGAVIGKALRPLESGQGLLPILVALQ